MRKLHLLTAALAATVTLTACRTTERGSGASAASALGPPSSDRTLAVLWFQQAAERRALSCQAFNIARQRLDEAIAQRKPEDKLAVVVDIDETILDNSPLEAALSKNGQPYTDAAWKAWSHRGIAKALPGAQPFLTYAASNNVEVFYVSNREVDEFDATRDNLIAERFPMVDAEHLRLKEFSEKGKERRRRDIAASHKIVLLMGDSLGDFAGIFEGQKAAARDQLTEENREKFGLEFIVLPNPMYGAWEDCLYPKGLSDAQKAEFRRSLLQTAP